MKKLNQLVLLLAAAGFFCTPSIHADVIYRETFGTPPAFGSPAGPALTNVGWQGRAGFTAATASPVGLGLTNFTGRPINLPNVNAGVSVSQTNGYVTCGGTTFGPGSTNWIVYTHEYTVNRSLWNISTISFYGGSESNSITGIPGFRVAIEIGGN